MRERLEQANRDRWRRCGVKAYFAEYYGEVAQLLHEAGLQRAKSGQAAFAKRASTRRDAGLAALAPSDPAAFASAQSRASQWLRDRLESVREIAAAAGAGLEDEHLGLAIWGVDHPGGCVTLWASHDRIFSDDGVLESRPLERDSRWVAVTAVTAGASIEQDPAVYTSRWRTIRSIPIVVADDDGDGRTISGALTLTSTTPLVDSKLATGNAPQGLLHELDRFLSDSGAQWFV